MDDGEAFDFIYDYFEEVFNKRDLEALDLYLDDDYRDEDIGEGRRDHARASKEYLSALFKKRPELRVEVVKVMCRDEAVTAYLEWYEGEGKRRRVLRKGVGVFFLRGGRIRRRFTHIYLDAEPAED